MEIWQAFFPYLLTIVSLQTCKGFNSVSVLQFLKRNSFACTAIHSEFLEENFHMCMFIKVKVEHAEAHNEIATSTVWELDNCEMSQTFEMLHSNGALWLQLNGAEYEPQINISPGKWNRLCVDVKQAEGIVAVEINYRKIMLEETKKESQFGFPNNTKCAEPKDEDYLLRDDQTLAKNASATLCLGSARNKSSAIMDLAGVVVLGNDTAGLSNFSHRCIYNLIHAESIQDLETWIISGKVSATRVNVNGICLDIQDITILQSSSNYSEHARHCKSLGGRVLYAEEFQHLDAGTYKHIRKCSIHKSVKEIKLWMHGGQENAQSLSVKCPTYVLNGSFSEKPCILETKCNACLYHKHGQVLLYGAINKFDERYELSLSTDNGRIILGNNETSSVTETDLSRWELKSSLHDEVWALQNQTLPLGRNLWKNLATNEQKLLTFTTCSEGTFTCSDGSCKPLSSRCNGIVECDDESDEEACYKLQMKSGYNSKQLPPPAAGSSKTDVYFYVYLYNMADISSSDGTVTVDYFLILLWNDSRLILWNPIASYIDCKDIWSPDAAMADGFPSGFRIETKTYHISCSIRSDLLQLSSDDRQSKTDPFMGRYVDGKDEMLAMTELGIAKFVCRFNLRKYPFGTQTCQFVFYIENDAFKKDYKFISYAPFQENKTRIDYNGPQDLGEYEYIESNYKLVGDDTNILITMKLKCLYGFHILNSFTPSVLMSFIALSTFFFPLENFNERIMVSITSLLVLAALYSQANNTSVKTPYFKLIDIWYVVLIIYNFSIVVCQALINYFQNKQTRKSHPANYCTKHDLLENDSETEDGHFIPVKLNFSIFIFSASSLIAFLVVYFLLAFDKM